jgi:6-phosphogluconolactonase
MNRVFATDTSVLADLACSAFLNEVKKQLVRGDCVVAIPGGSSIETFFIVLARRAHELSKTDWQRVHIVWSDERCVPPTDEQSNYALAERLLLQHILAHVHRFRGEIDPATAVEEYNTLLVSLGGRVHITVLGVGPDGHIASLFPRHELLHHQKKSYALITNSPKPPACRVTLTPLQITESVVFLFVIGAAKQQAYEQLVDTNVSIEECPAKLAVRATTYLITDREG